MQLRRYWIEFDISFGDRYLELLQGCGVTAYNQDDALQLIRENILKDRSMPTIRTLIEDVDISTLDKNHVLPNMGVSIWRGIWFPSGYQ